MLNSVSFEAPWDLAGLVAAVEAFRAIYIAWEEHLRPMPDPETACAPADGQACMLAMHLLA